MLIRLLIAILCGVIDLYCISLVLYIVLPFLKLPRAEWMTFIERVIVEPVLTPTRRFMNGFVDTDHFRFDLTPVLLLIALILVHGLLTFIF